MEGLQGHINHIPCGGRVSLESLEREGMVDYHTCESCLASNLHQQMPFLHMLLEKQSREAQPSEPSSFALLLRLQDERLGQQQLQHRPLLFSSSSHWAAEIDACPRAIELESCVTYAPETLSETRDHDNQQQQQRFPSCKRDPTGTTAAATRTAVPTTTSATRGELTGEKRKRKRSRAPLAKNMEEAENQRMTHIAVERNRRKLMNDHLCSLRSLVPPSFIPRGDQASTIGGAIEYVKELEQLLQSLQVEKQMRAQRVSSLGGGASTSWASPSFATAAGPSPFHDFFTSPQYTTTTYTSPRPSSPTPPSSSASSPSSSSSFRMLKVDEEAAEGLCSSGAVGSTAGLTPVADIEATVVHTHVNLKILSPRRPGQLLRVIAALEDLHMSVLHLNITSSDCTVLYTLNLKIEEECKLGSADEIATAVHQMLSLINFSS